ncbi:hypothetical protein FVE85_1412 [Porphyridium purpureum]|uniref:Uncharacterized protein n=1 Tax=Porphyridium purpureum TaxID=35688 RepID=A0A5J4YXR1_PORPP|nr:hypothetical protein FVE85_1412 [Porphyridium purpureum]|eukprot:POR8402..scf209_3
MSSDGDNPLIDASGGLGKLITSMDDIPRDLEEEHPEDVQPLVHRVDAAVGAANILVLLNGRGEESLQHPSVLGKRPRDVLHDQTRGDAPSDAPDAEAVNESDEVLILKRELVALRWQLFRAQSGIALQTPPQEPGSFESQRSGSVSLSAAAQACLWSIGPRLTLPVHVDHEQALSSSIEAERVVHSIVNSQGDPWTSVRESERACILELCVVFKSLAARAQPRARNSPCKVRGIGNGGALDLVQHFIQYVYKNPNLSHSRVELLADGLKRAALDDSDLDLVADHIRACLDEQLERIVSARAGEAPPEWVCFALISLYEPFLRLPHGTLALWSLVDRAKKLALRANLLSFRLFELCATRSRREHVSADDRRLPETGGGCSLNGSK